MAGPAQGKSGIVYVASNAVGQVKGWTYDVEVDVDTKLVKGDTEEAYAASYIGGGGQISVLSDQADTGQNALANGSTASLILYEGGNTTGRYKYTGSVVIESEAYNSPLSGYDTRVFNYKGILTEAVITP